VVGQGPLGELSLKHHQGKLPELEPAIGDLPGPLQAPLLVR
jgi:hypothetical protein